jgi:type IV secretion system protein VirB9
MIKLLAIAGAVSTIATAHAADPRIREIVYDPSRVIVVDVRKGHSTHVELEPGEAIRHVSSGLGADCAKPELPWCIDAKGGQEHIFIKAKSSATGGNTMAVVTDRRSYAFELRLIPDQVPRAALMRLVVRSEPVKPAGDPEQLAAVQRQLGAVQAAMARQAALEKAQAESLRLRLKLAPEVVNTTYSIAVGKASDEIVPSLVYDDGRFTYMRFSGNREVPAVFQVSEDGSESMVNARMEDDMLVADRVTRRLVLRRGDAVVGVFNEAFDLEGRPPVGGTTAPGVERGLRASAEAQGKQR